MILVSKMWYRDYNTAFLKLQEFLTNFLKLWLSTMSDTIYCVSQAQSLKDK